jgi:hypothetical protein
MIPSWVSAAELELRHLETLCDQVANSSFNHLTLYESTDTQIDLSQEYWLHVFEPAVQAWQAGSTPNPDVSCNKHVKFGALIDKALPERGGWLATGESKAAV